MCALARGYLEDAYFARHAAREQNYAGLKWPDQYRRAAQQPARRRLWRLARKPHASKPRAARRPKASSGRAPRASPGSSMSGDGAHQIGLGLFDARIGHPHAIREQREHELLKRVFGIAKAASASAGPDPEHSSRASASASSRLDRRSRPMEKCAV
jgi:hypothetical protein